MLKKWYLFFLFFSATNLMSQTGTNPFEITTRLDSVYNSDIRETEGSNIFDVRVENEGNNILDKHDDASQDEGSDLVPSIDFEQEPEQNISEDISENPFDVSHVPIRKSKLKKEANAFKAKKSKENKSTGSNAFLFYLSFFTGLILAIVINTGRGVITKIAKSITNENILKFNFREEQRGLNGHYLLLYVSFFINASIFIYLLLYNFYGQWGWKVYLTCLVIISAIYICRHGLLSALAKIFPFDKEVKLYSFTIESFNIFIGLLLIPINMIIAFGPENIVKPLLFASLGMIGIIIVLRMFRGLLIGGKYVQGNLFHFLLYLCTFEILPVLVLLKVVVNF